MVEWRITVMFLDGAAYSWDWGSPPSEAEGEWEWPHEEFVKRNHPGAKPWRDPHGIIDKFEKTEVGAFLMAHHYAIHHVSVVCLGTED